MHWLCRILGFALARPERGFAFATSASPSEAVSRWLGQDGSLNAGPTRGNGVLGLVFEAWRVETDEAAVKNRCCDQPRPAAPWDQALSGVGWRHPMESLDGSSSFIHVRVAGMRSKEENVAGD